MPGESVDFPSPRFVKDGMVRVVDLSLIPRKAHTSVHGAAMR